MCRLKVLFISWHFYLDASNGASISSRELLRALHLRGWDVRTLCGPAVDNPAVANVQSVLKAHRISVKNRVRHSGISSFSIDSFQDPDGIQSFVYRPDKVELIPNKVTGDIFVRLALQAVKRFHPNFIITYGGYWTASPILDAIRSVGAKIVFLLQNFAYEEKNIFDKVDLTITPSEYSARFYREKLGIETTPLPPIIRMEEIAPQKRQKPFDKKYALYVNPSLNKGVFYSRELLET